MTETPKADATRIGIECLMVWIERDRQAAAEHIVGLQFDPDGPGATEMIVGLCNVGMMLVFHLAKQLGVESADYAGYVAKSYEILNHLSMSGLPTEPEDPESAG